eukprot:TRINITY_DN296_c0_g1_i3.p1 TRINITY_DN296_c0_g1~~TRINITY_DN296_c0_g1_i3.p1  ORF type:complete len:297 (-),score=64.10 TRINITY_DN296_c0_g1_i3:202-978(-)
MIAVVILFTLMAAIQANADSIHIVASASGSSQRVKEVQQAVAEAIVAIEKAACKKGADVEAVAQAKKVVKAAAKSTAKGTISIVSTGNASGYGATQVKAVSVAKAIAEAIAVAAATVENKAEVIAKSEAVKEVSKFAKAQIEQLVKVQGDATAYLKAEAEAEVFVKAVAEALAAASAKCDKGKADVQAFADTKAEEVQVPETAQTDVSSVVSVGEFGFAKILINDAFATIFGSDNGNSDNGDSDNGDSNNGWFHNWWF